MLNEFKNLIPSEKEYKINYYIHNLIDELFKNEKIIVNSQNLLELLYFLTSNKNISTTMTTCIEEKNKRIEKIIHIKKENHLKEIIENQSKIIKDKDNKVKQILQRLDNDIIRIKKSKESNRWDDYKRNRLKAYITKTNEIKNYIEKIYFNKGGK